MIFRPADGFAGAVSAAPALPAHSSASTYPSFSVSILSRTIRKVLADPHDILLERSPNAGLIELRESGNTLRATRSIQVTRNRLSSAPVRNISIASCRSVSAGTKSTPSNRPLTTSWGKSITQKAYSYEELPLVRDGIDSDALARSHADILHTTPYRSFPSGVTATASSVTRIHPLVGKKRIVSSSNRTTAPNSPSPLSRWRPFSPSHQDRVIYLNTFSRPSPPPCARATWCSPSFGHTFFQQKLGTPVPSPPSSSLC